MNPLDQLKAMHLPQEPGLWPPAPGWWLLGAAILAAILVLIYWSCRRYRNNVYRRAALTELDSLKNRHTQSDNGENSDLAELLALVRRTAKTADPDSQLVTMPSPQLLEELDSFCEGTLSATGDDAVNSLAACLYDPRAPKIPDHQYNACITAARRWIKKHRRGQLC